MYLENFYSREDFLFNRTFKLIIKIMKNGILLLVFFHLSLILHGQFKFSGSVEPGYEDRFVGFYDSTYNTVFPGLYFSHNLYCALTFNGEIKGFSFYGTNKINFQTYSLNTFFPNLNEYKLGARYTRKCFFAGYNHLRSNTINEKSFSEAYDRLFLGLEFINLNSDSCKILNVGGSVEIGYENRYFSFYNPPNLDPWHITKSRDNFYSLLKLSGRIRGVNFYASNKTYFSPDNLFSYSPLLAEYILGLSYSTNKFSFGWEHMCTHAVEDFYFRDGYDKVYLHFVLFDKILNKK